MTWRPLKANATEKRKVKPRSMWAATHDTQKQLPKELEIDEFSEEDLDKIFNSKPDEKQLAPYKDNHDKTKIR